MARISSYPIDAVIQDKDAWIGTENTNRVTRQFTALGVAEYIDTKNVGLVFVGATNLLPGKKGLVPAPLAGQEGMFLKGDLNGGWTTIPVYTLDVPVGTTNVNLINTDGAGAIINSFITLTGGTDLTSVHTSGSQITFNHNDTTRTDTTSTVSPAAGASVPLVASVTSNATGHITAIDVKTVTWPADSDTTYTIDVPNDGTTSINLKGSDNTDDAIAFTTLAGNNGMTISRTNENTLNFNSKWQINNINQDGYVPKGLASANKFWATDANGNPGWTFQPSQDQTLTSTGTTNVSTGVVLSQNGGTVIIKGDGSTITAVNTQATNTITLSAINRVNTTYTLPVAAGAANTAVINLTDNSAVVSSVTFNGTANKIAISETVGNNGDITIGMPDNVTVTGDLTVSGGNIVLSNTGRIQGIDTVTAGTDAASKAYVDGLVSGGLTFRGTFNAATGEILSGVSSGSQLYNCPGGAGTRIAVAVGDYYIVATAGGSFYCSGATLDIGDSIIATAAAGADASVVTGWSVVQSDEGVASFTNANGTFVSAGTANTNATGAVTMGTIDLSATGTKNGTTFLRGDNTWAVPAYVSYSAMTTSTLGLGKIKYDFNSTPAAESQSTTTARTYGVTKNASDQLVVNVPWLNSSDVNSVSASGATTALSGLTSTPNTGAVVIGLDINGRSSLGSPAADDELMIYDTSTAKNVKVLVSDLASYAGSAATNQVTYWTSANEIGGAAGFTFAGGANGAVTMGGALTVSGGITANKSDATAAVFNSGDTNVVASFTSTDGTGVIQCVDDSGNVEFGAAGNNFVVQPAGGASQLTVGSSLSTFAAAVNIAGTLTLDQGSLLNGIINTPASLRINIDSDDNSTGEKFVVGHNQTNIDNNNELFVVKESGLTTIKRTGITGVGKNDMILQVGYEGNNGENNLIGFGYNGATNIPAYIGYTSTSGAGSTRGDLVFATRSVTTDSAPTERMRINSSGTIIGTGTYSGGGSVKIFEAQRSGAAVKSDWDYHDASPIRMSIGTSTAHSFAIKTSDIPRITVDNAGNVGMGIGVPTEKLDIVKASGNTNIRVYDSSANSEVGLKLQSDAKTWTLQNWGSGGDKLRVLNNAGTSVQTWQENGSVGIGTVDPDLTGFGWNVLTVMGGTGVGNAGVLELAAPSTDANGQNLGIISFNNGSTRNAQIAVNREAATNDARLSFWTSPGAGGILERMRIDSSGDVYNYQSVNNANTLYGYHAGKYTSTGASNSAFGYSALYGLTSGTSNVAIGRSALQDLTVGTNNIAIGLNAGKGGDFGASVLIGHEAGEGNTHSNNVGVGHQTLYTCTNSYNTALGWNAGRSIGSGSRNVALGSASMENGGVSGDDNVGVGHYTFNALTTGAQNTAVGGYALDALTTGLNNVAVGWKSLSAVTNQSNNVSVGRTAMQLSSSANCVAIGNDALESSSGNNQVAVGIFAGRAITTGSSNVFLGYSAGYNETTGSSSIFIGHEAGKAVNNAVEASGENVIIGHAAAINRTGGTENVLIGSLVNYIGVGTGDNNVVVGRYAGAKMTAATRCTFVGHQAGAEATTGPNNTFIGKGAGDSTTTGSNNTHVGQAAGDEATTGDYNICIGHGAGSGSSPHNLTSESGRVVIGDNSIGNAYIKVDWTITSDKRDKTEFKEISHGLDFVNKLKPTEYKFRKHRETEETDGIKRYGFLAQDILELEGENPVIIDVEQENNLKYKQSHLVPVLVKAIQELKAEIEILKNK